MADEAEQGDSFFQPIEESLASLDDLEPTEVDAIDTPVGRQLFDQEIAHVRERAHGLVVVGREHRCTGG